MEQFKTTLQGGARNHGPSRDTLDFISHLSDDQVWCEDNMEWEKFTEFLRGENQCIVCREDKLNVFSFSPWLLQK